MAVVNLDAPTRLRAGVVIFVLGVVALLILAYGWWQQQSHSSSMPRDTLRIALPTTPHAALLRLAADQGYFSGEGLDVHLVPASHGKAAIELLSQGQADLASAAEVPFVISVMNGGPFGIVASVASAMNEMAVVARRDHAIARPHDLAGKRVGVTSGTSGEYFLWAFMIRNKMPPDAVTLVNLLPGAMASSLADGTVDAVSAWQPMVVNAQRAVDRVQVTFTSSEAYRVTHVVVGHNDFLRTHPRLLEKLMRALLKAERFNREHPQQALNSVAQWLGLESSTLSPLWNQLELQVDLRQSHLVTLEDEAIWAMARGHAGPGPVPDFLPNLHLDALMAVKAERVTVVH